MRHIGLPLLVLGGAACLIAGCSDASMRRMMPRFLEGPSDERPSWLRDPPQQLERHPAPQGWGGDYLAAAQIRPDLG